MRESKGTKSWKEPGHAHAEYVRETWALGQQREPGGARKMGTHQRKKGGISGTRETGRGRNLPSMEGEEVKRCTRKWSRLQKGQRQRERDTGRLQEGEGERKDREEGGIAEGKPQGEGGERGRTAWSGSSQSPKKGFLYVIVLELPPMSVPSQPGLHTLLRSHRCGRA